MSYRIVIDRKNCQGHARCANIAPDLFVLDPDGYIATDGFDVPAGRETDSLRGAKSCPERVIAMLDAAGEPVRKIERDEVRG